MEDNIGSSEWSRHVSVSWRSTDHPTITEKIAMILNITECVNLNDEDEVIGAFNNIHQTVQEILLLLEKFKMENNISIRIYVKDGRLEHVVPESPWEGQMDVQVIVHDEYLDPKDQPELCKDKDCPEVDAEDYHYHDYFSTAVIRAESRE